MTFGKPKFFRRCRCHKWVVITRHEEADTVTLLCAKTLKPIGKDQTYVSTMQSDEEVTPAPEPRVQRGAVMD